MTPGLEGHRKDRTSRPYFIGSLNAFREVLRHTVKNGGEDAKEAVGSPGTTIDKFYSLLGLPTLEISTTIRRAETSKQFLLTNPDFPLRDLANTRALLGIGL